MYSMLAFSWSWNSALSLDSGVAYYSGVWAIFLVSLSSMGWRRKIVLTGVYWFKVQDKVGLRLQIPLVLSWARE
jgi:hypothetical protein